MFADFFKVMGEPNRLRIIRLLHDHEMSVSELVEVMQLNQPNVSQHLSVLKNAGFVCERREGQKRIHSLNKAYFDKMMSDFNEYMQQALHENPYFKEESMRMLLLKKKPKLGEGIGAV